MTRSAEYNKLLKSQEHPVRLYLSSFLYSSAFGFMLLAMPFVITNIGGSDRELGLCFGLNAAAYVIGCLLGGFIFDRFSPKLALLLSSGGRVLITSAIYISVILNEKQILPLNPIITVTVLWTLAGLVQSLFWPPIMGWISTGFEGRLLTRRLGLFNLSWSLAMIISPLIGGYLVEFNYTYPLIITAGLYLSAFLLTSTIPCPRKNSIRTYNSPAENLCPDLLHPSMPGFKWMSRTALMIATIISLLIRTQLALFLTENHDFTESRFGYAVMFMCLTQFVVFFIAGKTHRWHHKLSPFISAQVLLMMSMLCILYSSTIWMFYIATLMVGFGWGFIYSSHQYYGVSGGKKRSGRMAVHEIVLATGAVIGAILGGFLGKHFNRYIPYWFGFGCLIVSLVIQFAIWTAMRPKNKDPQQETA